jgi:pilus assembly protein Flp/PilA
MRYHLPGSVTFDMGGLYGYSTLLARPALLNGPGRRGAAGRHRGGNRDLQAVDFTEALPDYLRLPAMTAKLRQFLADESGATAIEYSLIAGGIALAIIATVKGIGPKLNTTFSSISSQLK